MHGEKLAAYIFAAVFLIVLGAAGFVFFGEEEIFWVGQGLIQSIVSPVAAPEKEISMVLLANPPRLPAVALSADVLEQGDTLIVTIGNVSSSALRGVFGNTSIGFFNTEHSGRAIGVLGIGAKKIPGTYRLRIATEGEKPFEFERDVAVRKREFPITELVVTEELKERGYTPETITTGITVDENRVVRDAMKPATPSPYFERAFAYPLDIIKIVGAYGNVRKSGSSEIQHLGVDLEARRGTPVHSINDGVVRLTRSFTNYGKTVIVDHGMGIYSLYLHLDSIAVVDGAHVARGEKLGAAGTTGYSLEPHLHFSVKIYEESVDPLRFIEEINAALIP